MEQKRNILLRGTESFSRGEFDNVALENGAIVLDDVAGRHVLYGCYTGPELALPAFCSLNMSWNAITPHGTVVEAQCRVLAAGEWSPWKSFGKWSPEYPRKSVRSNEENSAVFVMGDLVTVAVPGGANAVQMRIYMYTDDERVTPSVRLLAVAARPLQWEKQSGAPVNRTLYLPEYDTASHDPSFGASMDLPLTVTALMNRYGADILPEEIAYAMSDGATADCHNAAYAAAAAGACGCECYQAWMDLREVRGEIRAGYSLAVEMERGGTGRAGGTVWMGLRGFGHDDGVHADYVQLNDPCKPRGAVPRTMALTDFSRYFTGRALVLHPRAHGLTGNLPLRYGCTLKNAAEGEYSYEYRGEPFPLPEDFSGWLACTARGDDAFATTAQRVFHRLERTASGGIRLPEELRVPGTRYTIYAVDAAGSMRVAELRLPGQSPTLLDTASPARQPEEKES